MTGFQARLFDAPHLWDRDLVTLAVIDGHGGCLMPDGTWQTFPEGESATDMGLAIPRAAIEAIAQAIAEWQGHASHTDTEARVLREWLAVEQARVDKALDR